MKLAKKALAIVLTMLTLIVMGSAQTTPRSPQDNRNIAPTVGTGGPMGGATGLFTIYDGQTLRRGEYTFSAAYSNYDRDPGNVDITEIPVSFQIGLNDHLELFFNTDAYRGIKTNSPQNLSGFYLPNSRTSAFGASSAPAIVLAPRGAAVTAFNQGAVFRPTGNQPFTQFPYVGGSAGTYGFNSPGFSAGLTFGFCTTGMCNASLGAPIASGASALFPGVGSVYGSILPGVVLQTVPLGATNGGVSAEAPTVFSLAPSYLPDAPLLNRIYGQSAFNTFTVGAKWRWTGVNNPLGVGVIPFYRFYADTGSDSSGFNQLQRGASPGGNRGDIGLIFFADSRVRSWLNISANAGYIRNSSIKGTFPTGTFTLLDRPDEIISGIGFDFPVNRYFQPIMELRSTQYVGGRTPNAFENSPIDGLIGARWFPTRWFGFGGAYRYHFNSQDAGSFNGQSFTGTTTVVGRVPGTISTSVSGVPTGFGASTDPHGFLGQFWIGRRNSREAKGIENQAPKIDSFNVGDEVVTLPCPPGTRPAEGQACPESPTTSVATKATDPEGDSLLYNYTVSGGRIVGSGSNVSWDLSGAKAGSYTITVGVEDGCANCGPSQTKTITVKDCPGCVKPCDCPTISVSGPTEQVQACTPMVFTAGVAGGSQESTTYNWTVLNGKITDGQGTSVIKVDTCGLEGQTVTATVEAGGLCESCNNKTASASADVAPLPPTLRSTKREDFDFKDNNDLKGRLNNVNIELQNDPASKAYVIIYDGDSMKPKNAKTVKAATIKALNFLQYDLSRYVFVEGGKRAGHAGPSLEIYTVPAGATAPTPGM